MSQHEPRTTQKMFMKHPTTYYVVDHAHEMYVGTHLGSVGEFSGGNDWRQINLAHQQVYTI